MRSKKKDFKEVKEDDDIFSPVSGVDIYNMLIDRRNTKVGLRRRKLNRCMYLVDRSSYHREGY